MTESEIDAFFAAEAEVCWSCGHAAAFHSALRGHKYCDDRHGPQCDCTGFVRLPSPLHLLARVLYVPGVLAAVSRREWEEGLDAAPYSPYSDGWGADPTVPKRWPSWSKAQ